MPLCYIAAGLWGLEDVSSFLVLTSICLLPDLSASQRKLAVRTEHMMARVSKRRPRVGMVQLPLVLEVPQLPSV